MREERYEMIVLFEDDARLIPLHDRWETKYLNSVMSEMEARVVLESLRNDERKVDSRTSGE